MGWDASHPIYIPDDVYQLPIVVVKNKFLLNLSRLLVYIILYNLYTIFWRTFQIYFAETSNNLDRNYGKNRFQN